jgi:hypothetical protein
MVSAYGSGTERCSVESSREIWSGSTPSLEVRVACSTFAGQPVDTRFTLKHRAY